MRRGYRRDRIGGAVMQQTDWSPQPESHKGQDDQQHEEDPGKDDALAHTEMDWADNEQDRAATRDEVRREHDRWAEEES